MGETLRIKITDFYRVSQGCLSLFKNDLFIHTQILTISEMIRIDGDESCRDGHTFEIVPYSAFGIKMLASVAATLMIKTHLKQQK